MPRGSFNTHPPTTTNTIPVIDLDGDVEGYFLAPAARVQVVATQTATPSTASKAPIIEAPTVALEAPAPTAMATATSTREASSTPTPTTKESSLGLGSWLPRPSPGGDYLLGGIPSTDLEHL